MGRGADTGPWHVAGVSLVAALLVVATSATTTTTTSSSPSSAPAPPPHVLDWSVYAPRVVLLAFAAYQRNTTFATINTWTCPCCQLWGNSMVDAQFFYYEPKDLLCFVGFDRALHSVVLSFRGTVGSALVNWIIDLNFPKVTPYKTKGHVTPYKTKGHVHGGFYEGYLYLRPSLLPYVSALLRKHRTSRLLCTGHSLGGAMAQLAAVDLSETIYGLNASSVTYGTPRTGDSTWAAYFGSVLQGKYGRVVHANDMVPHLPPRGLFFHHTPNEAWYNWTNTRMVYCSSGESLGCSDGAVGDSVSDHLHYFNMSNSDCRPGDETA